MENATSRYESVGIAKPIPYINNARTHSPEQIKQIQASYCAPGQKAVKL